MTDHGKGSGRRRGVGDRNGKRKTFALLLIFMLACACQALAAPARAGIKPPESAENIEKGRAVYFKRCSFCHGLSGDGNGPAAYALDPRPRDFTLGTFKFRTTLSGELPLDEDLFRTVSRGLSGTAMQGFGDEGGKKGLTAEERWQVIYYIKTFAPEFSNSEYDPSDKIVTVPENRPPYDRETIDRGREVYKRAKCRECHGLYGRGDGLKALDRKDDWGFPIRIRNIAQPWKLKGGSKVADIYMRFSTGISGTPMPSYEKSLTDDERWDLANYVKSLQTSPETKSVLTAEKVTGALPETVDSNLWQSAEAMPVPMTGQIMVAPRWQNPSIERVSMKALYNDREIAFLIEWDDPFSDTRHDDAKAFDPGPLSGVGAINSYVAAHGALPRNLNNFRDSIALQFPVKASKGWAKPYFFRGDAANPVKLWVWKADLGAGGEGGVDVYHASGAGRPPVKQALQSPQIAARTAWQDGRWRLIMKRSLTTDDSRDIQFRPGNYIPLALNAWDGSNGEHRLIMSLSSWHYLYLEATIPLYAYLYGMAALVLTGFLEFGLVRKFARKGRGFL